MNHDPASQMHELSGDSLDLGSEFDLHISRGQHMQAWWGTILDDESRLVGLGDHAAEPIEVLEECSVGGSDGQFHLLLLGRKGEGEQVVEMQSLDVSS